MTLQDVKTKKLNLPLNRTTFITIILALLVIMPTITFTVSADIVVADDGSGDYTSIQDAINNAAPNETIWIKNGAYNEQLTISTSGITLNAHNGHEPILYLSSYAPGIDVQAENVSIRRLKIYGNFNPGGAPTILATASADSLDINDNVFNVVTGEIGNTVLYIESGAENIHFTSNDIDDYDIGILFEDNTNAVVSGNDFDNVNHSIYHGASIQGENRWYGTIQDAIDAADPADTVSVVSGPFDENLQINKSISLKGAQNNINPINGRSNVETILNGDTASTIRILQNTSDVTINGFKIQMPNKSSASNEAGIMIDPGSHAITIKNNIFENITDGGGADTTSDESYAIMVYGRNVTLGGQTDIIIEDNLIQNVEEYGIAINDNTSFVTITGNRITDLIGANHATEGYPPWAPSWPDIICSAIHLGGQVGPVHNITIYDNILTTQVMGDGVSTAAGSGIMFAGVAEWSPPNRAWEGFEEIYVYQNRITNNSMGILLLTGNTSGEITIHEENGNDGNNLSGNTLFAINNFDATAFINATHNWWGDITGPYNATDNPTGLGDNVTGNVSFWPWFEFGNENNGYSIPPIVDYDIEGPQVNFGEIIQESTDIEINAHDDESGLFSLTYRIWNTTHRWGPWMNYTDRFSLTSQGNHRVQYNATDFAGTSTYVSDYIYESHRVDDVAPIVTVLYPNGGEFEFDSIPIEWTAADQIFDQGQLSNNNSLTITEDYPGHIQSFMPTEDSIDSIQLFISGDDANISVKLFSSIYPVPTVIGQSRKQVEDVFAPGWIDFPFSSSIDLYTTQTYYIGVTQEIYGDTGFSWYYFNDSNASIDKYPYGHAWVKQTDALVNESSMDFAFKTMYWFTDIDIDVKYSNTGIAPWSTIAENEINDGIYNWDTVAYGVPDGPNYRIQIVAKDMINNIGSDSSDEKFIIDNVGPSIYNVEILDTTIDNSIYTKDGDTIEISATIGGDPEEIYADLSSFGKGTEVAPSSFTGGVAKWMISGIICSPHDGEVIVTVYAKDATGDSESNTGSIISDNTNPSISIVKPLSGFYFMDGMRLLPFSYPFIIGQITVEIAALDDGSGVKQVEFYLDNDLEANVTEPPYKWLWDRAATGFFDIEIKAYDHVGHYATDEITDLFIINLDIIGHD